METATVYFDLKMTVECPHCHTDYDLENVDSEYWTQKFADWINNEPEAEKLDEGFYCHMCKSDFELNQIAR